MASAELERLWAYRQPVEAELSRFLDRAPAELGVALSADADEAFSRLKEYCLRPAKRIRGSLAAVAYDTVANTTQAEPGIKLGATLELLHAYLLIIDDVMDRSALRRGLPTLHSEYFESAKDDSDQHEAEMLAIDIGCLAQHLANLLLVSIQVPAPALQAVQERLHRNLTITGIGQFADLRHRPDRPISEADVLQKYRYKTSHYTFVNPLQLGFSLAGINDTQVHAVIQRYGEAAGIAFQIRDDQLSIWGDVSKHGKSNLDDIHEGKVTLLLVHALQTKAYARQLRSLVGNPSAGPTELQLVRQIFADSGAQTYTTKLMDEMVGAAITAVQSQPIGNEKLSHLLVELVDYITTRES